MCLISSLLILHIKTYVLCSVEISLTHYIILNSHKWPYVLFLPVQINAQINTECPWLVVHPIWTIKISFFGPLHYHQGALDLSSMQCAVWQIAVEVTHVFSQGIREEDRVYNQPPTFPPQISFVFIWLYHNSSSLQWKWCFNSLFCLLVFSAAFEQNNR